LKRFCCGATLDSFIHVRVKVLGHQQKPVDLFLLLNNPLQKTIVFTWFEVL